MLVTLFRKVFVYFFKLVLSIYFKEIQIIGYDNIPKEGPIIFVGNHANQYIDPLSICCNTPHHICFLVAASTYRQKVMGFFAKLFGAIPVERPQDIAVEGRGEVEFGEINEKLGECVVTGHSTEFKRQAFVGDTLKAKGQPDYIISEVTSDAKMIVKAKEKLECEIGSKLSYKIAPKVDQSQVFKSVWDELKAGK